PARGRSRAWDRWRGCAASTVFPSCTSFLRPTRAGPGRERRRLRRRPRDQLRPRGRARWARRTCARVVRGAALDGGGRGHARSLAARPIARGLREATADVSLDTLHVITRLTLGGSAENTVATIVA